MMAALVLMTAACSSDDNDITTPTPQPVKPEGITITATLAPKNGGDDTRGLDKDTYDDKIVATWEKDEKIAILYEVSGVKKKAQATVTAVDSKTGAATIQFTVDSNTADNTTCTLVFPYTAAKDDNTGVKDAATLLAKQTGSITSEFMDVRVGAGKIQIANPGLTVTTQPAAQNAIFQIKAKAPNFSITLNALTVTIDGNEYAVNLANGSGWSDIYIALPPVTNKKVSFLAKDVNGRMFGYSKSGVTFAAGKYYKSELMMEYAFSVGADKRVCFSQGNLQYQPSTSTWKFADHQWDNLSFGCTGAAGSTAMDLFTWGNISSPTTTGTSYDTFSSNLSNTIAQGTTGSDWGYNAISNGGNKNSQWRTLTIDEWNYLLKTRTNGTSKYGFATVNDIHGIIIVPDGFSDPNKNNGSKAFVGSSTTGWNANIYTEANWTSMEEAGCVFLPAGGQRNGSSVSGYQIKDSDNNPGTGYYWSASCGGSTGIAYFLDFNGSSLNINTTWNGEDNKGKGYSVRLVRDL